MEPRRTVDGPNLHRNNQKAITIGNAFWEKSCHEGLAGIVANLEGDHLVTAEGHCFVNFSCCSYLDLDRHPEIIEGAIAALQKYKVLDHCISRIRIQIPALLELEASLSSLFDATVVTAISAGAATAGLLPLVASGHFTNSVKPMMIFDKNCHFSMNLFKPVCADETVISTCRNSDLNFIEDACKKYEKVAYVCDGTYSMGGHAPVRELMELQNKYGLFVYFDDSHSLSVHGKSGEGYVRSHLGEFGADTIIVATLNKAFGTSGAAILFGERTEQELKILERFGGPLAWSQPMNIPAIGASLASAEIHKTSELARRQEKLQTNIKAFDELVSTDQRGSFFPIKLVKVSNEMVAQFGKHLYRNGFYVSPVFFPIVSKDEGGLRVMLRSEHTIEQIQQLCYLIRELKSDEQIPTGSDIVQYS